MDKNAQPQASAPAAAPAPQPAVAATPAPTATPTPAPAASTPTPVRQATAPQKPVGGYVGAIATIRGLTVEVLLVGERPETKELLAVEGHPEVFLCGDRFDSRAGWHGRDYGALRGRGTQLLRLPASANPALYSKPHHTYAVRRFVDRNSVVGDRFVHCPGDLRA